MQGNENTPEWRFAKQRSINLIQALDINRFRRSLYWNTQTLSLDF